MTLKDLGNWFGKTVTPKVQQAVQTGYKQFYNMQNPVSKFIMDKVVYNPQSKTILPITPLRDAPKIDFKTMVSGTQKQKMVATNQFKQDLINNPLVLNAGYSFMGGLKPVRQMAGVTAPIAKQVVNNIKGIKPQVERGVGKKVWRGGYEPFNPEKITEQGVSVSTDKYTAKQFAGYGRNLQTGEMTMPGQLQEFRISPNAKILKWKDIPRELRLALDGPNVQGSSVPQEINIVNYAKSKGYDGVVFGGKYGENEIRVINTKVLQPQVERGVGKKGVDTFIKGLEKDQKRLFSIKAPKVLPPENLTNQQLKQTVNKASYQAETNQKGFKQLLDQWFGKRQAAETSAMELGTNLKLPVNVKGEDVISHIEGGKPVNKITKQYVKQLRDMYDSLYKYANKSGVKIDYLPDYITHIWDRSSDEVAQMYRSAKKQFNFGGKRIFPTYEEGIKMGLKPKFTNPQQIITSYIKNLEQTKANIDFIKALKDQGFIVSKRIAGFEPIVAPGFQATTIKLGNNRVREGLFYAPPEIAKQINTIFSNQTTALTKPARLSGAIQDITLSGGIPKTPLNAWTFAQLTKETLSGRVKGGLTALYHSMTEGLTNKYISQNSQFVKEQQLNNIPIQSSWNISSLTPEGTISKILQGKYKQAWNQVVNEPTFKRFMPILQTEFYKDIRQSALSSGKSTQDAIKIASEATKRFYGLTNSTDIALRNPLLKDTLSTFTFAPRYRETMINFWINNLKSMKNPLALENRNNVKFIVGATLTYLAYDRMNVYFTGHHMVDNNKGQEDKLLIPLPDGTTLGVPFLSSIATLPRMGIKIGKDLSQGDLPQAITEGKTLLSQMVRTPLDVATNQNYFGQQIYEPGSKDQVKDIATYAFGQYQHPYTRGIMELAQNKQPLYATVSKMFELPFRFYSEKTMKAGNYYANKDEAYKDLNSQEKQILDKWSAKRPEDITGSQSTQMTMAEALEKLAYPKLLQRESQLKIMTALKNHEVMDPFYQLTPEQQQVVLRLQTFYPGDPEKSKQQTANIDWLKPYWVARTAYFDELIAKGTMKANSEFETTNLLTPEIQKKLDIYYSLPYGTGERTKFANANPDLVTYWEQKTEQTNQKRELLGLSALEGFSKSGTSKYGTSWKKYTKKPKKVTFAKIKSAKIKTSNIKIKALPKIKIAKAPTIKPIKTKNIKVKKLPKYNLTTEIKKPILKAKGSFTKSLKV